MFALEYDYFQTLYTNNREKIVTFELSVAIDRKLINRLRLAKVSFSLDQDE